jgi:small conductance mechanosensitive channel
METLLPEQLRPFMPLITNVIYALIIFMVGWSASKWVQVLFRKVLKKSEIDEALARFLASISQYLVLAATVIVALDQVGIETTSLVALLATAGLAIGLALQGSLAHFASGVMILFFRPFTLGDRITAGGQSGKVDDIGLFATTILTGDNEKVIVPNSTITSGSTINHTTRGTLRGNIQLGIAYGSDLAQAMEVMVNACKQVDQVLEDPEPSVFFSGFGASSLDFIVRPWARSSEAGAMLHNVRIALYDNLNEAGIEIPFDQIVMHQAPPEA